MTSLSMARARIWQGRRIRRGTGKVILTRFFRFGVGRRLKGRYARLPLFWRSFAYFLYRYILRGGFLEGRAGFTWHFFQGWWYRSLVDARIAEIKRSCSNDPQKIAAYLSGGTQ